MGEVSEETRARWRRRLDFILENSHLLSDWEEGFIDSVELWLSRGVDLTMKQSSKLSEIYHEVEGKTG